MTQASKLALITALATERVVVERGRSAQSQQLVIQSGIGAVKAREGLRAAVAQGAGAVVLMGFAAGLRDDASPGRILVPNQVLYAQSSLTVDADWHRRLCQSLASMHPATDPLLCIDSPLLDRDAKAAHATRAIGCDMESAAILELAQQENIPAAVIRVVLDGPNDVVPSLAIAMANDAGDLCWPGRGEWWLDPPQWWQLLQLIPRFRLARRRLGEAAKLVIRDHGSTVV